MPHQIAGRAVSASRYSLRLGAKFTLTARRFTPGGFFLLEWSVDQSQHSAVPMIGRRPAHGQFTAKRCLIAE
jgi:hypothetical protein